MGNTKRKRKVGWTFKVKKGRLEKRKAEEGKKERESNEGHVKGIGGKEEGRWEVRRIEEGWDG